MTWPGMMVGLGLLLALSGPGMLGCTMQAQQTERAVEQAVVSHLTVLHEVTRITVQSLLLFHPDLGPGLREWAMVVVQTVTPRGLRLDVLAPLLHHAIDETSWSGTTRVFAHEGLAQVVAVLQATIMRLEPHPGDILLSGAQIAEWIVETVREIQP